MVGEIAHRVAREVLEEVEPDVYPDSDDGAGPEPASGTPQRVFNGNQPYEQRERSPNVPCIPLRAGHCIDEQLHADLHADGTRRGACDQGEQARKVPRPTADIVGNEAGRAPQERWDRRYQV